MALQHYRASILGQCLNEALSELRDQGKIQEEGIERVNNCFDTITSDTLGGEGIFLKEENQQLAEWYGRTRINIKGHLYMFRGVDSVWTLLVKDANLKVEPGTGEDIKVDFVKIIAMQKNCP